MSRKKEKRKFPVQTLITVIMVIVIAAIVIGISLTKPGNSAHVLSFPSQKTWWAKRISDDFSSAGRLSKRQIKYAAEAGFKSIVSLFNFSEGLQVSAGVYLPSSAESIKIAEITEILFEVLPVDPGNWNEIDALKLFRDTVADLPRPTLVACNDSYYGMLFVLLYLILESKSNPETDSPYTLNDLVTLGQALGHDYTMRSVHDFIIVTTRGNITVDAHKDTPTANSWNGYWLAKPITKDCYISGQVYREHLPLVETAGFRSVINLRLGVTDRRGPSQEQVALLNIQDDTDTYALGGRQSASRLLETRLDPSKPTEYISPTSTVNYESRNPVEFGDDVGYNEGVEQEYINDNTDLVYYHLPVGGEYGYDVETFNTLKDVYIQASAHGRVLVHSRTGYRAAIFTLAVVGYLNCKDSTWAMDKAHSLGYHFTEQRTPAEYQLIKDVLDGQLNGECSQSTTPRTNNVSKATMYRPPSWTFLASAAVVLTSSMYYN